MQWFLTKQNHESIFEYPNNRNCLWGVSILNCWNFKLRHINPSSSKPFWRKNIPFYNKNVTYVYFAYKNTQNISIRSQLLTRWTTFLGHLPKRLYFDAESVTNGIQNWSIMKIMMHHCMLNRGQYSYILWPNDWSVCHWL